MRFHAFVPACTGMDRGVMIIPWLNHNVTPHDCHSVELVHLTPTHKWVLYLYRTQVNADILAEYPLKLVYKNIVFSFVHHAFVTASCS